MARRSPHRTYTGKRDKHGHAVVHVIYEDGDCNFLHPRHDLYNHSISFDWGYDGKCPAQLALAILANCLSDDIAISCHHKFKYKVIAKLDRNTPWILKGRDVTKFVLDMMVPLDDNWEQQREGKYRSEGPKGSGSNPVGS